MLHLHWQAVSAGRVNSAMGAGLVGAWRYSAVQPLHQICGRGCGVWMSQPCEHSMGGRAGLRMTPVATLGQARTRRQQECFATWRRTSRRRSNGARLRLPMDRLVVGRWRICRMVGVIPRIFVEPTAGGCCRAGLWSQFIEPTKAEAAEVSIIDLVSTWAVCPRPRRRAQGFSPPSTRGRRTMATGAFGPRQAVSRLRCGRDTSQSTHTLPGRRARGIGRSGGYGSCAHGVDADEASGGPMIATAGRGVPRVCKAEGSLSTRCGPKQGCHDGTRPSQVALGGPRRKSRQTRVSEVDLVLRSLARLGG